MNREQEGAIMTPSSDDCCRCTAKVDREPARVAQSEPGLGDSRGAAQSARWCHGGVVTVNDVLDGPVVLDIECLDRICPNA